MSQQFTGAWQPLCADVFYAILEFCEVRDICRVRKNCSLAHELIHTAPLLPETLATDPVYQFRLEHLLNYPGTLPFDGQLCVDFLDQMNELRMIAGQRVTHETGRMVPEQQRIDEEIDSLQREHVQAVNGIYAQLTDDHQMGDLLHHRTPRREFDAALMQLLHAGKVHCSWDSAFGNWNMKNFVTLLQRAESGTETQRR